MSNYYLDTEFLEGPQKKRFLGIPYGKTKNTIDLISIGIVCEDGREYYAISKDFNLKEAWNRYDLKINKRFPIGPYEIKEYWIRKNVLKPIFDELVEKYNNTVPYVSMIDSFSYRNMKKLINRYGKSNTQIADEIKRYTNGYSDTFQPLAKNDKNIKFHAYYADYDWVVFCWLFGRMIDLPKGFPMFAYDIQQLIIENNIDKSKLLKEIPQTNCHNAIQDARWNKNAYNWIKKTINEKREL